MRLFAIVLGVGLASPGLSSADEAEAAVRRGVEAAGGAARLKTGRAVYSRVEGTLISGETRIPFRGEAWVEAPTRCRAEVLCAAPSGPVRQVVVVSGETGWARTGDGPHRDLELTDLVGERVTVYVTWVAQLYPLLEDRGFVLAALAPGQVGGRRASGVQVSRAGWPEVELRFDDETGFLIKTAWVAGGSTREEYLGAYQELPGGAKRPTVKVVYKNGARVLESRVAEYKPLDRLDDGLFRKPGE